MCEIPIKKTFTIQTDGNTSTKFYIYQKVLHLKMAYLKTLKICWGVKMQLYRLICWKWNSYVTFLRDLLV